MLYVWYHALNTSSLTFEGLQNNITIVLLCYKIGPLRCWPGGLCLSRSIGDIDVGEFIVPVPYVKQVKVLCYFQKQMWEILLCLIFRLSIIHGHAICQYANCFIWLGSFFLSPSCQILEEDLLLLQMAFGMHYPQKQLLSLAEVCLLSLPQSKLLR